MAATKTTQEQQRSYAIGQIFTKNCPKCSKIVYYSDKYKLQRAVVKNSICRVCNLQILNKKQLGKHWSPDTEFKVGVSNPNKNKTYEEIYGLVKAIELKIKNSTSHKGYKHTEEQKRKISSSHQNINIDEWRGYKSLLSSRIRNCLEYKNWRQKIFKRDNFTCQICHKIGSKLNADHIKPFFLILKENKISSLEEAKNCKELWHLKNGRTLCLECHKNTETWGYHK